MSIYLTGLPASNPLGYLAAVGVLTLLERHHAGRLRWAKQGACWVPEVEGFTTQEELVAFLLPLLRTASAALADLPSWKPGEPVGPIIRPKDYLGTCLKLLARQNRRGLDLMAALATDCVLIKQKKEEEIFLRADRSRLHMASGTSHCYLLKIVQEAAKYLTAERLAAALYRNWDRQDVSSRSGWDYADMRDLARIEAPVPEPKKKSPKAPKSPKVPKAPKEATGPTSSTTSMWGAILLAWEGLTLFPVFPERKRSAKTTGFVYQPEGASLQQKGWLFVQPVWVDWLTVDGVRTVLALQEIYGDGEGLRERGIPEVLRSRQILMNKKALRFQPAGTVRAAP
jgi:hypothetical protein